MYREALKKAAYISYIMMSNKFSKFKSVMMSYACLREKIPELKSKYSQYEKISDYDTLVAEVIQVYFTRFFCYLMMNFNSKTEEKRLEAYNCAKVCCALSKQYLAADKNPNKQFVSSFTEIA